MTFRSENLIRRCSLPAAITWIAACATTQPPAPVPSRPEIRVLSSSLGQPPAAGAVTRTTVHESQRTVTQVLRIAPGARIAEHHHPHYDETFLVQQGRLTLVLNGKSVELSAGEFVVMPSGTVISGTNAGDEEARVVVAFSNAGTSGPLSVPGSPHH